MATIRASVDEVNAVTVFEIAGTVAAADIVAAIKQHFVGGGMPHALWDYSQANFHELDADDYGRIACAAKTLAPSRPGGRTAFVAPGALEAVALKMLEASSKTISLPIPLHICATREEGIAWLAAPT